MTSDEIAALIRDEATTFMARLLLMVAYYLNGDDPDVATAFMERGPDG